MLFDYVKSKYHKSKMGNDLFWILFTQNWIEINAYISCPKSNPRNVNFSR